MEQETSQLNKWIEGIPYELAFWNNVYRWDIGFSAISYWSQHGKAIALENFDVQSYLSTVNDPLILDVGCGMSFVVGDQLRKGDGQLVKLDVHHIDPLAPYYNTIARRHHRQVPQVEFGMMEYLSASYPNSNVDLIIIQNALDHSSNPMKGVLEALQCLKVGGVLYLNHHPNEAEKERYKGFHQYNINTEDGHLIFWNNDHKIIVDDRLAPYAVTTTSVNEASGHIVAVIRKASDLPIDIATRKQDELALCQALISQNQLHHSLRFSLSYHFTYWKYDLIHFFIQRMPWDWRMKLKRMLKR